MKELNLKHEAKRYGCAVLAATIMALNIRHLFVQAVFFREDLQDLLCCSRTFFRHLWGLQFRIR